MNLQSGGITAGGKTRYSALRADMVMTQIVRRNVTDRQVLAAMRSVPRHEFVPGDQVGCAYEDQPLPIGEGQTISQPYIVALMTELLELKGPEKILEVGTGSGYQAAVLAEIVSEVYTIEIVKPLMERAVERFERLFYRNIEVRNGDAYRGWSEEAPFDGIIVTAASKRIPEPLLDQLARGGRLVIPVGESHQELMVVTREDGLKERRVIPVRFVPMTGEVESEVRNESEE